MGPRKSTPAVASKPPSTADNITTTHSKQVRTEATKVSKAGAPRTSTYRIKRYRNGILNLEKPPAQGADT